jgi:hypothetical protein
MRCTFKAFAALALLAGCGSKHADIADARRPIASLAHLRRLS